MTRKLFLLLPALAFTLCAFQWSNQKKEKPRDPTIRQVSGIVRVPDGSPAVGAVVQLKNLKTLQVRSYIAQAEGRYQFQNLSTNIDYELRATYKDMASPTRTLTVFDTRWDATVNLQLEASKTEKTEERKQ